MRIKHRVWYMYVLECSDGTYYCGITTDLKRRVDEHNDSKRGAKYTRSRRPVRLVYHRRCANRSEAGINENYFKKLRRSQKEDFIKNEKF